MDNANLYTKLMNMRVDLQNKGIEKTGQNEYSKFKYFELGDFLPQCNEIASMNKTIFIYQLHKEEAVLTLINCENLDEKIEFSLPLAEVAIKGANGIQNIGGLATYTRRYLYMIAFEISENDTFDPNSKSEPEPENKNKLPDHQTKQQQKEMDDIAKAKIPQVKIHTIEKELGRTGVDANAICERYKVDSLSDITEEMFVRVMDALKKTPSR
ncbi:MAG TPA: recombinase [Clostridiales bacterium]|nr:recombinase [Clostridiales bacterium]